MKNYASLINFILPAILNIGWIYLATRQVLPWPVVIIAIVINALAVVYSFITLRHKDELEESLTVVNELHNKYAEAAQGANRIHQEYVAQSTQLVNDLLNRCEFLENQLFMYEEPVSDQKH